MFSWYVWDNTSSIFSPKLCCISMLFPCSPDISVLLLYPLSLSFLSANHLTVLMSPSLMALTILLSAVSLTFSLSSSIIFQSSGFLSKYSYRLLLSTSRFLAIIVMFPFVFLLAFLSFLVFIFILFVFLSFLSFL